MVNYYEILELSPKASPVVIRGVYQLLLQHYSLDNNSDDPEKTRKLNDLKHAFEILSDPEKRKAYDVELAKVRVEPFGPFEKSDISMKDDETDGSTILSRIKWKRWGWAVSILAVVAILISMVRPDPEKATRGQLAVKQEAEKDRKELEAALKQSDEQPVDLGGVTNNEVNRAKTESAQNSSAGKAAP